MKQRIYVFYPNGRVARRRPRKHAPPDTETQLAILARARALNGTQIVEEPPIYNAHAPAPKTLEAP